MTNVSRLIGAALTVLGLTACTSTSPSWDERFGEAARMAVAEQVIAPDASKNTEPVAGIDGKAAQGAMGEYAKSFRAPESPPNVFTIGVGSAQ